MTVLADNEYELRGVVMANDRSRPVLVLDVDLGSPTWVTNDREDPESGTRHFGRETITGPTWTFTLLISAENGIEARKVLADLSSAWKNREGSRSANTLEVLRYRAGGQTRRVYGRPRNFVPTDWSGLDQGIIECTGQFVTADSYTYDDDLRSVSLTIFAQPAPGFTFPVTFPFAMAGTGQRQGVIDNIGGNASSPARVTFTGPIINPSIEGTGWGVGLNATLAYDETVTIDARTQTVTSNIRGSIAGALTRHSWFRSMRIEPGSQVLYFTGSDPTGRATATVEWYPAHDDEI